MIFLVETTPWSFLLLGGSDICVGSGKADQMSRARARQEGPSEQREQVHGHGGVEEQACSRNDWSVGCGMNRLRNLEPDWERS